MNDAFISGFKQSPQDLLTLLQTQNDDCIHLVILCLRDLPISQKGDVERPQVINFPQQDEEGSHGKCCASLSNFFTRSSKKGHEENPASRVVPSGSQRV